MSVEEHKVSARRIIDEVRNKGNLEVLDELYADIDIHRKPLIYALNDEHDDAPVMRAMLPLAMRWLSGPFYHEPRVRTGAVCVV